MAFNSISFLESLPHPAYATDTNLHICFANASFAALIGCKVVDLVDHPLSEVLPSSLVSSTIEHENQARTTEAPLTRSHEMQDTNGRLHILSTTKFPMFDADGTLFGIGTLAIDLTASTQAHRAATREATFVRQVIDVIPNLIYAKDKNGRFTLANRAFAQLLGTTADQLLGQTEEALSSPEESDAKTAAQEDRIVLDGHEERITPEEPRRDASGKTRWFRTIRRPLEMSSGQPEHLLGVAADITEYRNTQQAKLQIQEERMEAIGRLAGGIAHDFNNLLTVLRTSAALLKEETEDQPDLSEMVDDIIVSSDRAAKLTQHLLAYGRRQLLQPVRVNLNTVVTEITSIVRRIIGGKIHISIDIDPTLPAVEVDRSSIDQILVNLATNARDAMPTGGRLTIATRHRDGRLTGADTDGIVELSVSDTGHGMPPDVLDRIFEPFYTTKPQGQGTGLGLSTVYGIARQSNGDVIVDSAPEQGATFTVRFPSAPGQEAPEIDLPKPSETLKSECVLVVDDESGIRRTVQRVLERRGYNVVLADGLTNAKQAAATHSSGIDLMLIDIVMPEANGFEVARVLRGMLPEARVLHMTGYTEHTLPASTEPLMAGYLQKPFTPDQLLARIRAALEAQ